jgi:hypothetical protein
MKAVLLEFIPLVKFLMYTECIFNFGINQNPTFAYSPVLY